MHLRSERAFTLTIPEPSDFALTVAKPAGWHWSTPKEVFSNGTLWSGVRIGDIPVGLARSKKPGHGQSIHRIPAHKKEMDPLREKVLAGLGAYEDLAGFSGSRRTIRSSYCYC